MQVTETQEGVPEVLVEPVLHPAPPRDAIADLVRTYLGSDRRAGQGIRNSSPDSETIVLERAGFDPPRIFRVPNVRAIDRTVDDIVALVFSESRTAPHLFGERLSRFEADLRQLLSAASPGGVFTERVPDTEIRIWRRP